MNFDKLRLALERALSARGAGEYEIYYVEEGSTSVETLNKEVNSFSSGSSAGICLRVAHEGRMGYASTELMEEGEMAGLVDRAIANARATEKEDLVGIYAGGEEYDQLSEVSFTAKDASELRAVALDMAAKIYEAGDNVKDGTASQAITASGTTRLYNSHGLALEVSGGVNVVLAQAVVSDGTSAESDYEMRELTDGLDLSELAEKTVSTANRKLTATLVPTGKYNVIIDGKRMRMILSAFASAFSAKSAQMGMSRLAGKVGEKIAADIITVTDDPQREGMAMRTNFDAEGVPARKKAVIEGGVLKTLLHNRETAAKDGCASTGNASKASYSSPIGIRPYAFCIEPSENTLEELYAMAGEGILITELKGLHAGANAITGDFSIESSGFMIRDGKLCEAVKSFTVAGNFFELLNSVSALSDKAEVGIGTSLTTFGSPAVLIRDMNVSGK